MRMLGFTAEATLAPSRPGFGGGRFVAASRAGIVPATGEGCGSFCERNGETCCCLPGERCVVFGSHCWCEDAHPHVVEAKPIWR